jgi:hypothetical protein
MKEQIQKYKKFFMFAAILAAVFIGYSMFFKKEETGDLVVEAAPVTEAAQDNRELLVQLQSLNAISLNATIFSSQLFNTLQDNTVIIENRKPEGRRNPFLPIGYDNGSFVPDQSIQNASINTNGLLNSQPSASSSKVNTPSNIGALNVQAKATSSSATSSKTSN